MTELKNFTTQQLVDELHFRKNQGEKVNENLDKQYYLDRFKKCNSNDSYKKITKWFYLDEFNEVQEKQSMEKSKNALLIEKGNCYQHKKHAQHAANAFAIMKKMYAFRNGMYMGHGIEYKNISPIVISEDNTITNPVKQLKFTSKEQLEAFKETFSEQEIQVLFGLL